MYPPNAPHLPPFQPTHHIPPPQRRKPCALLTVAEWTQQQPVLQIGNRIEHDQLCWSTLFQLISANVHCGGMFECHLEPVSPHACLGVLGQEGVLGDSDLPHQGVDMGDTPVGVGRHAHPQHQFHPAHAELRSSELASSEREMRELAARCCFSAITTWSRSRDQRQIS